MSLRARILLLVLLATLVPATVISVYQFENRRHDVDQAKHNLSAMATYAAENLDDKIKGTVQLLHGLSRAPDIITPDKAACSDFLAEVLARYPQYTGLLTITPDGDLHCDSLRSGRRLNVSARDYFKQTRATLKPAFDVVFGGLTRIAVLQVSYPVLDGQGTLKFVLLASLNLSQYAQAFVTANQYPSIRILIWNRTGTLMVSNPDAGSDSPLGRNFAASALFRFAASGNASTPAELPDLDGVPRVWALGVMPEPRGGGARITVGVRQDALTEVANKDFRDALALLLGVSLLAFIGAWYVAETSIRRHVQRIASVLGRVKAGELGARIGAPYPRGELGELMEVVDGTSGAVHAQQVELESRSRDLLRLNRIHSVLSSINLATVRVRERQALLAETCRIAVEHGGFGIAWVGKYDAAALDVTPIAWAGVGPEQFTRKSSVRPDMGEGQGAMGRAIRERKPVYINDILAAPPGGGQRREEAIRRGYRSLIALPLIVSGEVFGNLTLFTKEPNFFNDEEVALLAELAGSASFALESIASREKIERLSRIRAVTSEINAAIVHARNPQSLFEEACRIAVEQGRLGSAWIGTLDSATLDITPVAWAGEGSEEMRTTKSTARDDPPRGQGAVSRAIRSRRAVFNNNLSHNSFGGPRLDAVLKLGFRSMIALPLLEGDNVVGTFTIYAKEPGFFDEDEQALLTELAANVSFALEHMAQQQRIEKLSRIRAVSSGINAAIVRSRNKQALFYEACHIAVEHGKFGITWIGEIDHEKLEVKPVASAGLEDSGFDMHTVLSVRADSPQGAGVLPRAVRDRRIIFDNDITVDAETGGERRKEAIRRGYRSAIVLPLIVDGAVEATFSMFAKEVNYFDDEEVGLLTELASNISLALEHMARQEKFEKLSRIRAISSEINVAIVRIRDRKALFKETCRIASERGGFELVWIATIDQEKQAIEPVAWTGFSEEIAHGVNWKSITTAQGTLGEAIKTRKAAFRNNIESDVRVGGMRGEALKQGCRSTVSLPLVVGNQIVALISLFAAGTGYFDKDELALLDEVASNISFALENIEREERIARLSRIEAVMGSISGLIVRARDRDELFREACRIAVEEGRFRMSFIGIVDRSTMKVVPVASAGKDEELMTAVKGLLSSTGIASTTMVARAIREKKAVVANDSQNDPQVLLSSKYVECGVRAMAILPLMVSDEAVGVLALYSEENGYFDEEEMKLLTELTGNIAFAIDHIAKQEQLDYFAYYDALTGLANRALFTDRIGQQTRARGNETPKVALILLNLERFRNINEAFGRHGGDDLLKAVAHRLEDAFHGKDNLARIGADVFGVVIRGIRDAAAAAHAVESRILACFREPYKLIDSELRVAARAGIALFPADGADADTLIRNAEAALKKAQAGGEHYLFYAADMNARVAHALSLETRLRKAVETQQFVLHYQPKIELASGKICGLEALIRWQDPEAGLVAPGAFIPLLEETGLILEVGKWALGQALAQHREWTARGYVVPHIAVNVSAIQLQQKDFADIVIDAVHQQGSNPEALELEVTESLLMKDIEGSIRKLSLLRELGISIAMDDFGTGYSSLSYLARLPLNSLKIDRSFITEMANSPQDMSIVTTIVALAHSLNLRVVAEGVETENQSKLLKLLKCDEAQGYLFSKPLPAAGIEPLLRALAMKAIEPERVQ
jgi:diguanylate cyclase (GGDEF)-like protein